MDSSAGCGAATSIPYRSAWPCAAPSPRRRMAAPAARSSESHPVLTSLAGGSPGRPNPEVSPSANRSATRGTPDRRACDATDSPTGRLPLGSPTWPGAHSVRHSAPPIQIRGQCATSQGRSARFGRPRVSPFRRLPTWLPISSWKASSQYSCLTPSSFILSQKSGRDGLAPLSLARREWRP